MSRSPSRQPAQPDPPASAFHLRGGYWFRVPANFMKYHAPYLPPIALNVYIYLCYRANDDGFCWPSINRMARDLNLSRSSVQRAVKTLANAHLLVYLPRYAAKGGAPRSNYYRLGPVFPPREDLADADADDDEYANAEAGYAQGEEG